MIYYTNYLILCFKEYSLFIKFTEVKLIAKSIHLYTNLPISIKYSQTSSKKNLKPYKPIVL